MSARRRTKGSCSSINNAGTPFLLPPVLEEDGMAESDEGGEAVLLSDHVVQSHRVVTKKSHRTACLSMGIFLMVFVVCINHHVYSRFAAPAKRLTMDRPEAAAEQKARRELLLDTSQNIEDSESSLKSTGKDLVAHPFMISLGVPSKENDSVRRPMITLGNQPQSNGRTKASQPSRHKARQSAEQMQSTKMIETQAAVPKAPEAPVVSSSIPKSYSAAHVLHESVMDWVNIASLSDHLQTCESTIVTAYFKIPSKHKAEQYRRWMKFFLSIQDCLVIFASAESMDWILELRQTYLTNTVLIQMEISDLPIGRLHASSETELPLKNKFWKHQLQTDTERKTHKHFTLFWIWLSKSWFVKEAIQKNFFQSEYFMWQDIGSYRNGNYRLQKIMKHLEIVPPKTVLFLAHHPPNPPPTAIWCEKEEEPKHFFHSGSQGVGQKDAWLEYHSKFAETIDAFVEHDMFLGEDQCLLQATCQLHPDLCSYLTFDLLPVKEHRYFGLRHFLVKGGNYSYWRMPGATPLDKV